MNFPNWQPGRWTDASGNPLVRGFGQLQNQGVMGDPQVLTPGQFDQQWHLFFHGFYDETFTPFFHHLVSDDGFGWQLYDRQQWDVNPLSIFRDGNKWIVYYSAALRREPGAVEKYGCVNMLRARVSEDLIHWSEDIDILTPSLPWELEHDPEQPDCIQARNPCMIKLPDGRYRLYYSAGTIKLHDCGYEEPKYIGFAESDSPLGPFVKHPEPILAPDAKILHRKTGAGAIKVFSFQGQFLALYNAITLDHAGASRSAICLLLSEDGIVWHEAPYNPVISPGGDGWKKTLVYQLDLVRFADELRIYYNARNDTVNGREQIGCSILKCDDIVEKMWG